MAQRERALASQDIGHLFVTLLAVKYLRLVRFYDERLVPLSTKAQRWAVEKCRLGDLFSTINTP